MIYNNECIKIQYILIAWYYIDRNIAFKISLSEYNVY